jgi:hypothetical protein
MPPARKPVIERILQKVSYDHGCWFYSGYRLRSGYGLIGNVSGAGSPGGLTHRLVYEALVGPIPAGLQLDHLCRNRSCCNPMHLEPVTRLENVARGKGNAGRSRFSADDIGEMRRRVAAGDTQESVARDFGMSRSMVSQLVRGRAGWSATGESNDKSETSPQAKRTHCPQGHPYIDGNVMRQGNRRHCRMCRNEQSRSYYYARKGMGRTR